MMSQHRSLAFAGLALATLALAGCEKPRPAVTAWSGTSSVNTQALCWQADESQALGTGDCAQSVLDAATDGQGVPQLQVAPGDTVGVSVDPAVAEATWSVQIAGQTLVSGLTDTYFRFTFPETGIDPAGTGFTLQVIAQAQPGGSRGHWFFRLNPR